MHESADNMHCVAHFMQTELSAESVRDCRGSAVDASGRPAGTFTTEAVDRVFPEKFFVDREASEPQRPKCVESDGNDQSASKTLNDACASFKAGQSRGKRVAKRFPREDGEKCHQANRQ